VNHVDRVLSDGVERGHGFCIRFKRTLRDDQVGELGRDVYIRLFQRLTLNRAQPVRP